MILDYIINFFKINIFFFIYYYIILIYYYLFINITLIHNFNIQKIRKIKLIFNIMDSNATILYIINKIKNTFKLYNYNTFP